MRTDRRGFIGGLLALAVAPRAVLRQVAAPTPATAWVADTTSWAAHMVSYEGVPVAGPLSAAKLSEALLRTYNRQNYFAPFESERSILYDDAAAERWFRGSR